MKKMTWKTGKRLLAMFAAVTMMTGALGGCGNKASDKDEQGRTVISIGSWPDKEGAEKEAMDARKARFEEANSDVVILPDNWVFDIKTFSAKAAGGQLPTLYNTHFTEVPQIISAGYSADITDALKKHGLYDKFNKQILDIVSKDGRVYAFPFAAYVLGMAYNVEMFEAAGLMEADGTPKQPKNWDEVVEFAVKIKEATGKPGFIFPTANNNGGWIFTCLAWSFGAKFMEQDSDGKWKATFDSPETAAALQWIKDLKWKYDVLPANTLIDGTEYYKGFGTANAGMMISAGDFPGKVTEYGMQPDECGMFAMPAGPKRHVTLLGGSVFELSNKATEAQIDAALRWLEGEYTPVVTDEFKTITETAMNNAIEQNQLIGIKSLNIWANDTESVQYLHKLIDEKANANINHVKLYNDFTADLGECELQAEEPVCAQELYGVLDSCIQEVLVNENADCTELLKKAASDFQKNYLDNLDY